MVIYALSRCHYCYIFTCRFCNNYIYWIILIHESVPRAGWQQYQWQFTAPVRVWVVFPVVMLIDSPSAFFLFILALSVIPICMNFSSFTLIYCSKCFTRSKYSPAPYFWTQIWSLIQSKCCPSTSVVCNALHK